MMANTLTALVLASCAAAFSQQPPTAPTVDDIVSVKPSNPDGRAQFEVSPGGILTMRAVTLSLTIQQAYDVRDFEISGGPAWSSSDRYDIIAKPEDASKVSPADRSQMRLRIQSLLADRFQLKLHHETKEMPVYALVIAKNGSKLNQHLAGDKEGGLRRGRGQLAGKQIDMPFLALTLSRQLGRTVLDQTGLKGSYDVELNWTPDAGPGGLLTTIEPGRTAEPPASESNGTSIFTAIQEQLGLKLESKRGPVEVVVIDRVEKPSQN